jgi:hypothetical protein
MRTRSSGRPHGSSAPAPRSAVATPTSGRPAGSTSTEIDRSITPDADARSTKRRTRLEPSRPGGSEPPGGPVTNVPLPGRRSTSPSATSWS